MIIGVFSVTSHAASTNTAIGRAKRAGRPPNRRHLVHSSQAAKYMIRPWMKWLSEYQSVSCCEFSADCTTPCHNLTVPQVQIGTRPIASRIAAAETTMAKVANSARLFGSSVLAPALLMLPP